MQSFSLLTDLYQLTMAYGYWRLGIHEREAVFHLNYRTNPCGGNFVISCGLTTILKILEQYRFSDADLAFLRTALPIAQCQFAEEFYQYLAQLKLRISIAAVAEGSVVHPYAPMLRVCGPLLHCQLLESLLLNTINAQSMIATKAARMVMAACGAPVIELGLRSAYGPDGALSASKAAYIGGCSASSNVLAKQEYDIPIYGTHAHSWVTVFGDELSAFSNYAAVFPDNVVLLVDTYDPMSGIANAVQLGIMLRQQGLALKALRLDSGDLLLLSQEARRMLDAAALHDVRIIASNNLDEGKIAYLHAHGAPIDVWGVGSNLVSAGGAKTVDGVYKLAALQDQDGVWLDKLKISADLAKLSLPGQQQVRRYYRAGKPLGDVIYDLAAGIAAHPVVYNLMAYNISSTPQVIDDYDDYEDLLRPVMINGKINIVLPTVHESAAYCRGQVQQCGLGLGAEAYPVWVEQELHNKQQQVLLTFSRSVS